MKKKILGILIAVMMVGAVTGCGKTETSSADTTEKVVYEAPVTPTPTPTTETVAEMKEPDFKVLTEIWSYCDYLKLDKEFVPKSGETVIIRFDGKTSTAISDYEEWNKAWNEFTGESYSGYYGDVTITFGETARDRTVTYGDTVITINDV